MIVINSNTRQFNIPGADLVFGVESDSGAERKEFQCPRYVGNNLDIAGSFVRINYRNANGEIDSYLVEDLAVDGDNVVFSWVLTPKVTMYKGQIKFVMCVVGPDLKVKWHTTQGTGQVLEGLEPEIAVEEETADVVAQLVAMVDAQTAAVEAEGDKQIKAVQSAAEVAGAAAVAEIEAKGVNVRESIPEEYTALSEAVDGLVRGRAGAIVCEAAGESVVIGDSSNLPMQGLRIFGRSTQDGTPAPEAPVVIKSVENPVVTVAGKNLCPYPYAVQDTTINGITVTVNADKTITLNGTATSGVWFSIANKFTFPSGKYAARVLPNNWDDSWGYVIWNGVGGYFRAFNIVLDAPTECNIGVTLYKGATLNGVVLTPQIEIGGVYTEYEPPKGRTIDMTRTLPGIPVTSGGNYTDSDGQQWICDEVDLGRGVYVQRVKQTAFDGDEAWAKSGTHSYYTRVPEAKRVQPMCDKLGKKTDDTSPYVKDGTTGDGINAIIVSFGDIGINTLDEFKVLLTQNPLTVQYALASPIETPLSETEIAAYRVLHSNYPNTTVLNNAGAHMVVKYAADTKLYIDNKIAALVGG